MGKETTCKIPRKLVEASREEGVCLGVDEAGRGPVLGPMVYACAFWALSDQEDMSKREYDDSKKLTEGDRERMFEQMKSDDKIGYVVCELSARMLSEQMLRAPEPVSLNKIAHDATVDMINTVIQAGINIKEIYVDAVGNCEMYEKMLSSVFPDAKVCVRAKADSLFKVVSAASVCAKVTRDYRIANWEFAEKSVDITTDWGCGYPGDEKTKQWLMNNVNSVFGFPDVVRFSWQTTKNILEPAEKPDVNLKRVAKVTFPSEENKTGALTVGELFRRSSNKRGHFMSSLGISAVSDISTIKS